MANKDYDMQGKLTVRAAKEDDASNLHAYCFSDKSSAEVVEELKSDLSEDSQTTRLVADSSGYAVGHISVKQHPLNGGVGQVSNLAVAGPFRQLGVADHLIAAAEAAAAENGMEILEIELSPEENSVIQRYKDWGFSEKPIVTLQKAVNAEARVENEDVNEVEEPEEPETDEADAEQQSLLSLGEDEK